MQSARFGDQYVLRLDPGEEVIATLCDFVEQEDIRGGYFIAFGAFSRVRLQYFDVERNEYRDTEVNQQVEVVSLMGNIAWKGDRPKLHVHGAFGDGRTSTCSGHVGEGVVRPTLEVFLTRLPGELRREKDPETGLDLLDLLALPPRESGEAAEEVPAGQSLSPYTP